MSPSLLALSLSLVAASPEPAAVSRVSTPADASAASLASSRAKAGLLPRKAARSRVTYLAGAAIPDAATTSSPGGDPVPARSAIVDAGAVEVAVADADWDSDADRNGEAEENGDAESPTSEPRVAAPAGDVVRAPDGDVAPVVPLVHGAEVATTPATGAPTPNPAAPKQPEQPAAAPTPARAATAASAGPGVPSPEAAPPAPAVAVERIVDAAGEVVVRVTGPDAKLIAERVVCSLGDLPVLSTRRADDGSVVQVVADEWGGVEVRRDAVGRFVSARPIERAAHPGRQD